MSSRVAWCECCRLSVAVCGCVGRLLRDVLRIAHQFQTKLITRCWCTVSFALPTHCCTLHHCIQLTVLQAASQRAELWGADRVLVLRFLVHRPPAPHRSAQLECTHAVRTPHHAGFSAHLIHYLPSKQPRCLTALTHAMCALPSQTNVSHPSPLGGRHASSGCLATAEPHSSCGMPCVLAVVCGCTVGTTACTV